MYLCIRQHCRECWRCACYIGGLTGESGSGKGEEKRIGIHEQTVVWAPYLILKTREKVENKNYALDIAGNEKR